MDVRKYRKKPVIIEAIQYNGNVDDIKRFTNNTIVETLEKMDGNYTF